MSNRHGFSSFVLLLLPGTQEHRSSYVLRVVPCSLLSGLKICIIHYTGNHTAHQWKKKYANGSSRYKSKEWLKNIEYRALNVWFRKKTRNNCVGIVYGKMLVNTTVEKKSNKNESSLVVDKHFNIYIHYSNLLPPFWTYAASVSTWLVLWFQRYVLRRLKRLLWSHCCTTWVIPQNLVNWWFYML